AVVHAPVGPLLAPTVRLADALSRLSPARATGIALFQACCGVRAYRAATREAGSWDALQREFGVLLPVLCYHHVGPRSRGLPAGLSVTPERFERQLDELARGGFTCIAPEDWLAWCLEGRPLPRRPLLLTFDDGYADLAKHALPVLERRRLPPVVFLVTAHLGGTSEWDRDKPWPVQPLLSRAQVLSWAARGVR